MVKVVHDVVNKNFDVYTKKGWFGTWQRRGGATYSYEHLTEDFAKQSALRLAESLYKEKVIWQDGELK